MELVLEKEGEETKDFCCFIGGKNGYLSLLKGVCSLMSLLCMCVRGIEWNGRVVHLLCVLVLHVLHVCG